MLIIFMISSQSLHSDHGSLPKSHPQIEKTNELVSELKQRQEHKAALGLHWTVHHYECHLTDTPGDKSRASPSRALSA